MSAAEKIGAALRKKQGWHLVVLSSTVMPGSTGDRTAAGARAPVREKMRRGFRLCYNPEFIALGSVIRDMLKPDMI
jgi:UDPglucose 6-dehydrogenase